MAVFTLTVSSGGVDAISFIAMGRVFTAFLTGNLGLLGMDLAGHAYAPGTLAVLASMAGFASARGEAAHIITIPILNGPRF